MRLKLTNTALVFISLLLSIIIYGQQARQYSFTHFGTSKGLASSIVNNVFQDHKGFIWISTIHGLQRFDGNKFLTFRNIPGNKSTIPSDDVTNVYEDNHKNLWVFTVDNKVGIFNTSNFTYEEVSIARPYKKDLHINKGFVETSDGQLFLHLTTDRPLYRYNAITKSFIADSTSIPFPPNWKAHYIRQDKASKKIWISSDSGLAVYNPHTKVLSYAGKNREKEPAIEHYAQTKFVHYLHITADKKIIFEQWPPSSNHPVLHIYNQKTGVGKLHDLKERLKFGYHEIKSILEQTDGTMWIYGYPYITEYNDNTDDFKLVSNGYTYENSIRFNNVHSMYEDREKNIWISTENGLFLFNPAAHFFDNYYVSRFGSNPSTGGRVQAAVQLSNKQIWLGTRDQGLYVYSNEFSPLPLPPSIVPLQENLSIWDIHEHKKTGLVWLGMQGGKLIVHDPVSGRSKLIVSPVFENRAITQITEDSLGNLWFGTQGGNIVRWNFASSGLAENFKLIWKTKAVRKLYTDSYGSVWAATIGDGLLKFGQKEEKLLASISANNPESYQLWNNAPTDIFQYNDSTLLVAAGAINLIDLKTGRIKYLNTQNGLPSNTVLTFQLDKEGVLWLGMVNGLVRANLEKNYYTTYDRNDGIWDDNFNISETLSLPDGRLMFASEKSFLVFNPLKKNGSRQAMMPNVTDFKLQNRSLSLDSLLALDEINLDHDQNTISIQFSALSFFPQNKYTYYYKLEKLDKDWVKSDVLHQAVYSYIPPGEYLFKVKVETEDGIVSEELAAFRINVNPPFWKTWWFFGLLVLMLVCTVYYMDRERVMRLQATQKIRSEIAYQLHEDVNTTLNNINLLSQIAKIKADKNIEKSKEFIDQIGEKSHNMAIAMDDMLWSIDPANDSMEKTIVRIFEFADSLKNRHQTQIQIELDDHVRSMELDMKVRYEFLLICKEALRNLIQYAKSDEVYVHIACVKSTIILEVQANEIEIVDQEKMQLSKREMYRRAAVIGANLEYNPKLESPKIILYLPVKNGAAHHTT